MSSSKTYIAIDLKSFYASVECRERGLDPLTARLVVADASRTSKTICLAVTPALKAYGLSGRSRLFEVEAKAREIKARTGKELEYITAVPRMALYIEYSSRIYNIYLKYFAPEDIHVYSIDEVFIDATSYLSLYKMTAHELVSRVIQDVLGETGITATAGIAPNLFLCKIAMDIVAKHIPADKDGVRIAELDELSYRQQLWNHTPITDFWRIGRGIAARLSKYRIYTMGDIARKSLKNPQLLYDEFGVDAEILIDHAWGYEPVSMKDIKGYKSGEKSLGSGQVLHCPYDYDKAQIIVREMAELLALDLYKKKLVASSVTLFVGYDRESLFSGDYDGPVVFDPWGREMPKPAHGTLGLGCETNSAAVIVETMLEIFKRCVNPRLLVRRVNLTANNVIPEEHRQAGLFEETLDETKESSLQKARLEIMRRFGKNALLKGTNFEEGATTRDRNAQIGGHRA
ncbi:MAG: DNA methylase [Treponema sp.]|nr:DNA methylase [Candidatus Treponema equifaecale]